MDMEEIQKIVDEYFPPMVMPDYLFDVAAKQFMEQIDEDVLNEILSEHRRATKPDVEGSL